MTTTPPALASAAYDAALIAAAAAAQLYDNAQVGLQNARTAERVADAAVYNAACVYYAACELLNVTRAAHNASKENEA
jgi:hypothetical protein